jgi:hypothetical protein
VNIDYQNISQNCEHCGEMFKISRGSVYENAKGFSIYLAAMHQCSEGKLVHLAIAVKESYKDFQETCAVAMKIYPTESEFEMTVVDSIDSPWQKESYLGRMLNREEAINSSLIDTFFQIADHIVVDNPELNWYLNSI